MKRIPTGTKLVGGLTDGQWVSSFIPHTESISNLRSQEIRWRKIIPLEKAHPAEFQGHNLFPRLSQTSGRQKGVSS